MLVSDRIKNTQTSSIRKLTPFANEAKTKGIKVYHLNIGQPDIKTPQKYFDALKNYDKEILAYENSEGVSELRYAFSYFLKTHHIDYDYDEILITNGGSEALFFVFLAVCDEGDEIIVPEPYYSNYNTIANSCGVKLVPFETSIENRFHIQNKESILKSVTSRTKAILYSNPSNPTGAVYSFRELEMIAEVVYENEIYVISDEVYRELVYDNIEYKSIFSIEKIRNNLILIDSLSKRYSVCGSRIGMIASKNKELMSEILKLCQARLSISSIEQHAAINLLKLPISYINSLRDEYRKRRDVVCDLLNTIDGVEFHKPEGAFYIIISLPVDDSEDFCKWLLKDFSLNGETIMMAPANGFYFDSTLGKSQVRISYCVSEEVIKKSICILKKGLSVYKNLKTKNK